MLRNRTCILCWTRASLELRLDRRGRPYGFCRACMGRFFFHDARALYGLAVLPEQVDALVKLAESDADFRERIDGAVLELRAQLRGLLAPDAATPASDGARDHQAKVG